MPPAESFENPVTFGSIPEFLAAVLNAVIIIAIPVIVFFLIYAGFLFVTAQGNPEQVTKAKNALLYGIIGGVIIIGAVVILEIVQATINAF